MRRYGVCLVLLAGVAWAAGPDVPPAEFVSYARWQAELPRRATDRAVRDTHAELLNLLSGDEFAKLEPEARAGALYLAADTGGTLDEAKTLLERLLKESPDCGIADLANLLLARIERHTGATDTAVPYYDEAVRLARVRGRAWLAELTREAASSPRLGAVTSRDWDFGGELIAQWHEVTCWPLRWDAPGNGVSLLVAPLHVPELRLRAWASQPTEADIAASDIDGTVAAWHLAIPGPTPAEGIELTCRIAEATNIGPGDDVVEVIRAITICSATWDDRTRVELNLGPTADADNQSSGADSTQGGGLSVRLDVQLDTGAPAGPVSVAGPGPAQGAFARFSPPVCLADSMPGVWWCIEGDARLVRDRDITVGRGPSLRVIASDPTAAVRVQAVLEEPQSYGHGLGLFASPLSSVDIEGTVDCTRWVDGEPQSSHETFRGIGMLMNDWAPLGCPLVGQEDRDPVRVDRVVLTLTPTPPADAPGGEVVAPPRPYGPVDVCLAGLEVLRSGDATTALHVPSRQVFTRSDGQWLRWASRGRAWVREEHEVTKTGRHTVRIGVSPGDDAGSAALSDTWVTVSPLDGQLTGDTLRFWCYPETDVWASVLVVDRDGTFVSAPLTSLDVQLQAWNEVVIPFARYPNLRERDTDGLMESPTVMFSFAFPREYPPGQTGAAGAGLGGAGSSIGSVGGLQPCEIVVDGLQVTGQEPALVGSERTVDILVPGPGWEQPRRVLDMGDPVALAPCGPGTACVVRPFSEGTGAGEWAARLEHKEAGHVPSVIVYPLQQWTGSKLSFLFRGRATEPLKVSTHATNGSLGDYSVEVRGAPDEWVPVEIDMGVAQTITRLVITCGNSTEPTEFCIDEIHLR